MKKTFRKGWKGFARREMFARLSSKRVMKFVLEGYMFVPKRHCSAFFFYSLGGGVARPPLLVVEKNNKFKANKILLIHGLRYFEFSLHSLTLYCKVYHCYFTS